MTATRHVTLWCDGVGWRNVNPPSVLGMTEDEAVNWRCVEWIDHGLPTAALTRRESKPLGWVHRNGKDYCPDHAALEEQENEK